MVLVTGATGFIGRYLVAELLKENYEVGILLHKTPVPPNWLSNNYVKVFKVDITQEGDFSVIPKDIEIEAVFHLAAYIPSVDDLSYFKKCIDVNCIGTHNLLKFCYERKTKKVINSSTVSVYGETTLPSSKLREEHPLRPLTFYGMSKLMGEHLCDKYRRHFNINVISLRYSSVYGLGQSTSTVLPIFIDRCIRNQDIVIFGKGVKMQDFVYVKDVVSANLCALRSNSVGIYNIGSGIGTNIVELAKTMIKVFDAKSTIVFDETKPEDESQIVMDILKAEKDLGYRPRYDLESGLEDYYKTVIKNKSKL